MTVKHFETHQGNAWPFQPFPLGDGRGDRDRDGPSFPGFRGDRDDRDRMDRIDRMDQRPERSNGKGKGRGKGFLGISGSQFLTVLEGIFKAMIGRKDLFSFIFLLL